MTELEYFGNRSTGLVILLFCCCCVIFCLFVVIVVDEEKSVAKEQTASIMETVLSCFVSWTFVFLHRISRSIFIVSTCRRVIVK